MEFLRIARRPGPNELSRSLRKSGQWFYQGAEVSP